MVEHKKTYMVIFSPTAGRGWAFDRNYHYLGGGSPLWAPICVEDIAQVEQGRKCDLDLPIEEQQIIQDLIWEGHLFYTVWTKYFG